MHQPAFVTLVLALLGPSTAGSAAPPVPSLPTLEHVQRSDWLSVKEGCGAGPKAQGDGKSDDTEALQACFASIGNMSRSKHTVYLPPGKYIVKETLVLYKVLGGAQRILTNPHPRAWCRAASHHPHRPRTDRSAPVQVRLCV